ncbi:YggT family protein [Sporosarcina highlanderae]|uniref:YggT family protein n=1 Tax=Sporosarcina highlanderae TaxID=3035916 RepID=A0ABT8JQZ2_9BACL|nr:YggT family protein [Sporosarcina highlanderae]MDN4607538.1 YggT family protein [Sporosarcina highlanderae]
MIQAVDLIFSLVFKGIQLYMILLIIYILMSWVPASRETKFGILLGRITEPYLAFFRRFIPPLGMIDISPIVAIFVLNYLITRGVLEVYRLIRASLM